MVHLPERLGGTFETLDLPLLTAGRMLSLGKEEVSGSYVKDLDGTYVAPVFPCPFLTLIKDIVR